MTEHREGALVYYTYSLIDREDGVVHGVSSRLGGVSPAPYRSLNLGLHVGDEREKVLSNRRALCRALGIDPGSLTLARQVHGKEVALVGGEGRGRGALAQEDGIGEYDALVTSTVDVALMILVADCVPITLYDPETRVAAVAHGSWKGTAQEVAPAVVAKMTEAFNCRPACIRAGIGPSIGPCCYTVGENVLSLFHDAFGPESDRFFSRCKVEQRDRFRFDLWAATKWQLLQAGLREDNIEEARTCTSCRRDLFYSYRGEKGVTGRFGALIMLKGEGQK